MQTKKLAGVAVALALSLTTVAAVAQITVGGPDRGGQLVEQRQQVHDADPRANEHARSRAGGNA